MFLEQPRPHFLPSSRQRVWIWKCVSLKIELEINFDFELEIKFEFEIEFDTSKVAFKIVFSFISKIYILM